MGNFGNIILYEIENKQETVSVTFKDETFWLTQKAMSELFGVDRTVITKHLNNIFDDEELDKNSVCANFAHTATDGKNYNTNFYNLDAIIAVGYRVNSKQATRFRQWATATLKEYITKGFVLNDDMLKNGKPFGKDYFKELLERVRSIRASERRIYQQITDIYAECSIDYDRQSPTTNDFYAMIQNKFHYAITGKTAAEIIYSNADHMKDHMGLTTWKNAPDGRILKKDVSVAKNYLSQEEIRRLENTFTMEEFVNSVNAFLAFRKYDILHDKGRISNKAAVNKANEEFDIYNKNQKIFSDFDKEIKKLK